MEKYKPVKISILLIDICFFLLVVFSVVLPYGITWYAEVMGRGPNLASTVMVTFYSCVPFAWGILLFLRRFLKNVLKGLIFAKENLLHLKKMSVCCLIIAVITTVAGNFYMPFFFVGATFGFVSLMTYSLKSVIGSEIKDSEITENSEN